MAIPVSTITASNREVKQVVDGKNPANLQVWGVHTDHFTPKEKA